MINRSLAVTAIATAAILAGCATPPPTVERGTPKVVTALAIAPFAIHEDCMRLAPGDRLEYRFASDQPLAFNIHYHEGKLILTPISRADARTDAGIFDPQIAQDYCLMWEAGAQGATLDYRYTLRGKR